MDISGNTNKKITVQVVLLNDKGEVLAVSRKDNHKDFGLVGGKLDGDEEIEAAAIRETKEETGLDISNLRLIFAMHKNGWMGYTYIADYTGEINYNEPHVVKWTSFEEIIQGSFGRWNQLVSEALTSMGVNYLIDRTKEKDFMYEAWKAGQELEAYTTYMNEHHGSGKAYLPLDYNSFEEWKQKYCKW